MMGARCPSTREPRPLIWFMLASAALLTIVVFAAGTR